MPSINSFRDLLVWQKSVNLAVKCHHVAKRLPRGEQPVLGYQVRKSGRSIPSNVAEGFSRHSTAFYIQHLWTAHASGAELETQLTVGTRIGVISEIDAEALIRDAAEVGRTITDWSLHSSALGERELIPVAWFLAPALRPEP
jgi:four helix bundle protein